MNAEEYYSRCYVLGRYSEEYRAAGTFSKEAGALIEEGLSGIDPDGSFLSHMISRDAVYEQEDRKRCPVLIYKQDSICYGVLNGFADALARELDRMGQLVEIYDLAAEGEEGLLGYRGRRFRAIVGFQTYAFSIRMADGRTFLHDLITGPKFNVIFDHPVWMRNHLTACPRNLSVITHDPDYCAFVQRYYPAVERTFLIPPGGEAPAETAPAERTIPLSFVGSYHDWHRWLPELQAADDRTDGMATAFLQAAEADLSAGWEADLRTAVASRRRNGQQILVPDDSPANRKAQSASEMQGFHAVSEPSPAEFRDLLYCVKPACFIVMTAVRERIIRSILNSGLTLDVCGDSWRAPALQQYRNLRIHPEVTPEESLTVYRKSQMSLNIMSWHKGGMTERIANIQLAGALLVSDRSTYLDSHYRDGEDALLFDLGAPEELPEKIRMFLSDPEKLRTAAEKGQRKAEKHETWQVRAAEMLEAFNQMYREIPG